MTETDDNPGFDDVVGYDDDDVVGHDETDNESKASEGKWMQKDDHTYELKLVLQHITNATPKLAVILKNIGIIFIQMKL